MKRENHPLRIPCDSWCSLSAPHCSCSLQRKLRPFMSVFSARELGAGRNIPKLAKFQGHVKRQECQGNNLVPRAFLLGGEKPWERGCQGNTWYMSTATIGWLWLGIITTVLPLMTAGANRDINATNGHPSGQAMPITPTGSWILTVAP